VKPVPFVCVMFNLCEKNVIFIVRLKVNQSG